VRLWVQTLDRPTLKVLTSMRRKCGLCKDICKWLEFQVFSDKENEVEVPSHNTSMSTNSVGHACKKTHCKELGHGEAGVVA